MHSRNALAALLLVTPGRHLTRRANSRRWRLRGDGVGTIVENRLMIAFRADIARERAAKIALIAKTVQDMREVEFGPPAQLAPRTLVDIDAVDRGEQPPAARSKELRTIRIELAHNTARVACQRREMALLERAGGRHDIAGE